MVDLSRSEKQIKTRILCATDDRDCVTARGFVFVDLITEHEGVDRVPDFSGKAKKRRLGGVESCSGINSQSRSR